MFEIRYLCLWSRRNRNLEFKMVFSLLSCESLWLELNWMTIEELLDN